jgi:hypothetical protein
LGIGINFVKPNDSWVSWAITVSFQST